MNRRYFLGAAAASGAAAMGWRPRLSWAEQVAGRPFSNVAKLPQRVYKDDVKLSILGFPGFALKEIDQDRTSRLVAESFERGINYFDVAPSYGDAESKLGPALAPYRKDVFLACKTSRRDKDGAAADLKRSFELLQTDRFDLYQLHHITDVAKDVDAVFAKGGAMEVLIQAKKEGRVRYLGFSAHSPEAALAAMDRYDFDSAMFPINFACMMKSKWGPQIMAKAKEKGVACLALKALARQKWPKDDPDRQRYATCWYQPLTDMNEADLSLRYTLSQHVTAALPPASERMHRLAMLLAADYRPIEEAEQKRLESLAQRLDPVFA